MRCSRAKSLFFYVLYFGLLLTVAAVLNVGRLFVWKLKWTSNAFNSYLVRFLADSFNLSVLPATVKCKLAGSMYRLSPRMSGFVFKKFNQLTVGLILLSTGLVVFFAIYTLAF
jgi:hypothetical protein